LARKKHSRIDRGDAYTIATKIGATVQKDGKHARADLRVKNQLILTFGIRHGAKSGHGHLCGTNGDLKLSESNVLALARCTMSKDQYFEVLKQRGILPP
jgi:hypothetical protein